MSASETQVFRNLAKFRGGKKTFALPDLRGRVAVHADKGPQSEEEYTLGKPGGSEAITLDQDNIPQLPDGNHAEFEWTSLNAVNGRFWAKGVAKTEKPVTNVTMKRK